MGALPETPEESIERKEMAAFVFGVGIVGFFFLALVALLLSPRYPNSVTGDELIGSSLVAFAVGVILCVALISVWFDKAWLGPGRH